MKNELMGKMVENLNLDDGSLQVFMHKLGMIQEMDERISEKKEAK